MRGGENKYNDTATHVSEPSIFCFHPESLVSIFLNLETKENPLTYSCHSMSNAFIHVIPAKCGPKVMSVNTAESIHN